MHIVMCWCSRRIVCGYFSLTREVQPVSLALTATKRLGCMPTTDVRSMYIDLIQGPGQGCEIVHSWGARVLAWGHSGGPRPHSTCQSKQCYLCKAEPKKVRHQESCLFHPFPHSLATFVSDEGGRGQTQSELFFFFFFSSNHNLTPNATHKSLTEAVPHSLIPRIL